MAQLLKSVGFVVFPVLVITFAEKGNSDVSDAPRMINSVKAHV